MKAKRLDDMWMSQMAKKDKWSCNTLPPTTTKPKVPWTMNKNTQPQKKEEEKVEKGVKEFDKCRKNIKSADSKTAETVEKAQPTEKMKETEVKVDSKTIINHAEKSDKNDEKDLKEEAKEAKVESKSNKKEEDIVVNKAVIEATLEKKEEEEEKPAEKLPDEKKAVKPKDVQSRQPKIDMEAPIDFDLDEVKKPDPRVVDSLKPPKEETKKRNEQDSVKASAKEAVEPSAKDPEPACVTESGAVPATPTVISAA